MFKTKVFGEGLRNLRFTVWDLESWGLELRG